MQPGHVTVTKVGHHGQALISYPGELIFQDQKRIVVRCLWTENKTLDLGAFALEQGDIFIEYYYHHCWFNIFAIHDRLGRLKGWYCNVTYPVEIVERQVRWRDLALDFLVAPGQEPQILDQDEFEALSPSESERAQALAALDTLQNWLSSGHAPFERNGQGS